MNVNFEYAKTLTGEGSILLLLSLVPYAGWILGIIGVVLFLKGIRELSNYYQDKEIYQNSLTGIKFYIIAIVAAAVAIASIVIGVASATGFNFTAGATFVLTPGFAVGLVAFLGGLIIAFVFYILAALSLRKTFNNLAQKSGEGSFTTAGNLLWWGAILSIILVGFVLIFVAWIFATIGFFSMKSRQYQQYIPQANGAASSSTQPTQVSGNGMNLNNYTQQERGI
ncbi:MAG TPA: DUF996 domain-containing protein [Candidatus Nanoarchaeia archaeon]|nr:DUF996 domain-containing protein [Candidatus Nanoarchaeia archaeon]